MRHGVDCTCCRTIEDAIMNPRVERHADGGQLEPVKIVCGWCGGPVGASRDCERSCERGQHRANRLG